jgi:carboxymethylenebutenolidase
MARIVIPTHDGQMEAYIAQSTTAPTAAIIVLQEAFGVTGYIESVVDRLAGEGYFAIAPALFHRTGSPVLDYTDIAAVRPHMQAMTGEGIRMDLDAVMGELTRRGFVGTHIGAIGFCMGGSLALYVATYCAFGACVGFYGGGVTEGRIGLPSLCDLAKGLQVPWLGLYGDRDQGIPIDDVEQLRAALDPVDVPSQIVRYPDAGHGFHCHDRPNAFHEESASAGWTAALEWFTLYLK